MSKKSREERIRRRQEATSGLTFNIISVIIVFMWILNLLAIFIGYGMFTHQMTKQASMTAYRTVWGIADIVNVERLKENIDENGGENEKIEKDLNETLNIIRRFGTGGFSMILEDPDDPSKYYTAYSSGDGSVDVWDPDTLEKYKIDAKHMNKKINDLYEKSDKIFGFNFIANEFSLKEVPAVLVLAPISDEDGNIIAVFATEFGMYDLPEMRESYIGIMVLSALALILIGAFFVSLKLKKQMVVPLKRIIGETTRFARENSRDESVKLLNNTQITEIIELGNSVDKMERDTIMYMENLAVATAERERIAAELDLATKIQMSMLPSDFPAFPDRNEFDLFAMMKPAKEVGGDFYDFFMIDEDHLGMIIADVSGKGIPAALFMATSKNIIRNYAKMGLSPKEVMEKANDSINETSNNGMFVTVWFGILTISTGHIIASNAGHEYPVIKDADGEFKLIKDKHCFVLGGMEGILYKEYEMQLNKGDVLFVYTDGLAEATNGAKEMYGTQRIVTALNSNTYKNAEEIIMKMKEEVDGFVGDAEQFDDLTMLTVRFLGDTKA